jgi:hypothetical protein
MPLPCHHSLEEYLTTHLDPTDLIEAGKGPLFRTIHVWPSRAGVAPSVSVG